MFSFLFLHQSVNRLQTWILGEKLGENYFLPTNIQKRQSRMKNSTCISLLMTRLIISEVHTSLIWVTLQTVSPQVLCTDYITQKLISKLEIKEKSLNKHYKPQSSTIPQVKLFSHTKVHLKVIIWDSWHLNSLQVPISCHSKHLKIIKNKSS